MTEAIDRAAAAASIAPLWRAQGRRLGVAVAALSATLSLALHVPLWVAAIRGGLVLVAAVAVTEIGLWALLHAIAADAQATEEESNP